MLGFLPDSLSPSAHRSANCHSCARVVRPAEALLTWFGVGFAFARSTVDSGHTSGHTAEIDPAEAIRETKIADWKNSGLSGVTRQDRTGDLLITKVLGIGGASALTASRALLLCPGRSGRTGRPIHFGADL